MAEIPVKNSGKNPLPVAGRLILPGETRFIEEQEVPPHLRPNAPEPAKAEPPADPIKALLKGKVPEIVEAIPNLSDEQLDQVEQAESAKKNPRIGVVNAIAVEKLKRADAKAAAEDGEGNQTGNDGTGEGTGTGEGSEGDDGAGNSDNTTEE